MKFTALQYLAPCMVATVIAFAATAGNGQEMIVGEGGIGESIPAPIISAPIESAPVDSGTYVGDLPYSSGVGGSNAGIIQPRRYGSPDLFYNYYTQGYANQVNAQMYLSPLPIPPNVGHTFYTYQPFYPEEMLYWHKNRFHRYYDNGRGMNRTRAVYFSPPIRQAASNLYWNFLRIPR